MRSILTFTLSLFVWSVSVADDGGYRTGNYVGISVGQADSDDWCSGGVSGCDDTDTGGKLFVGTQFNENFATEVNWAHLGDAGNADVDVFSVTGIGSYPINNKFSIYADGGFGFFVADDDDGEVWSYGAGAQYNFTDHYGLRAEWQMYADDISLISLGIIYLQ